MTFLLCALALAVPAAGGMLAATDAQAQGRGQEERETRQVQALSERVFNGISRAQELAEEDDYAGAHRELDRLRNMSGHNEYERAQIAQMTAFLHAQQENYPEAIRLFEEIIGIEEIPAGMRENVLWTLVQLTMSEEQYEKTLEYGNRWLQLVDNPGGDPYYLLAVAHYQLQQFNEAVDMVTRALEVSDTPADSSDREDWYGLMRASYFELEDNENLRDVLEIMVTRWPKKDYWVHLASVYAEFEREAERIAIMEMLYDDGQLDRESELITLASLYITANGPYKGARVIEQGMADGIIEETYQNYRLLSQAWMRAQDDEAAIPPLREAAARADDGNLYLELAQSHLNLYQYEPCVDAARNALNRGGLDRDDRANLVLGHCLMEQQEYDAAIDAFRMAAQDERTRDSANSMINWIQQEIEYRANIERDLAQF